MIELRPQGWPRKEEVNAKVATWVDRPRFTRLLLDLCASLHIRRKELAMKRELLIDCHTGTQDLPALLLVSRVKDAEIRALTACYDPDRPVANIQDLLALREAAGLWQSVLWAPAGR